MMKPTFLLVLLGAFSISAPHAYSQSKQALRLGAVTDKSLLDGCGCSIYRIAEDPKNDRYLFVSDMAEDAFINLDGKDVKLRVLSWKERKGQMKVGGRSSETYAAGDVNVRLDFTVRKVCPPKDESCEVTWYDVKMTVTRKGQRTIVNAKGLCGC